VKQKLVTFIAGVVFAVGLGISGMTNPAKVIGFLDVTGAWDPSLAFVMGGAIGIHVLVAQWAKNAPSGPTHSSFPRAPTSTAASSPVRRCSGSAGEPPAIARGRPSSRWSV
jgi:hypothetical protein